ncbi:GGDEF domain-containing protein [Butyrivibrio sp. CB08]|uniref:GGDEF domain-containing protein n=1 Tax=Butyrivibrio sp. CB08 TaxID=2364879 RepID=UPI000EAA1D99|nr:GGDEF domain-containing protein [Butyrivibrio sp. CB08]RKM59772.1 GGDEF domain-containing protein [Butyrivibrio sp. CB08]
MNILAVATSDYIGLMLLVAMLISSRIRRADSTHSEYKIFSAITFLTMIACVVDFFVFYSDGKPGKLMKAINMIGNTYCFMANPFFIASWCLYEDLKLYRSKVRVKKIYTYAFIPAVLLAVIALVNNFVPIIYTIDANNVYSRLPASYLYYIVDTGYIIFSVYILKKFEERYGKVRFFPLYLMVGPIVIGCALQVIFYGISLIWVSISVGLTAIYMSLQNEFSYLDKLTGLYNRAYLDYQLENLSKEKKTVGGIMIDVDYFKSINDNFGHHAGDEALIDVARVITFAKPDKAIATRFAGDEFIILVTDTSEKEMNNILKSLHDEVDLFNETEGRQYKLSLSMGYSLFDQNIETLDDFLKHMDDNMYEEKQKNHIAELAKS